MRIAISVVLCLMLGMASASIAAEKPVTCTAEQVEALLKNAPDCPMINELDDNVMGLKLRPIDYIHCTDPTDPHDFMDQGTSRAVSAMTGPYRVTAAHRHAFFSYRFRSAGKDKPVLIVIQYPDNAERTMNFSTHESGLSGRSNRDWSLETGVYTGGPFPLSKKMQYHTFIMWPQDEWPAVLVSNFSRFGHSAAASQIWVYAIEGDLPKLDVTAPDPANQRRLSHFNSFAFLPTAFHFGLRSPNAIEHMLDYAEYIGVNELAWCVFANNTWGTWADIPSIPSTGDRDHLDKVLAAMDKRGGFGFIGCIGTEQDHPFIIDGTNYLEMSAEELRDATIKAFDEFFQRYGKYTSLRGIGLGSQYGIRFYRQLAKMGVVDEVVAALKAKYPDKEIMVFAGGRGLHMEYFSEDPSAYDVYAAFEAGKADWPATLGAMAEKVWQKWGQDPAEMNKVEGLTVYEQYQPDDFGIFGLYSQQPRAIMYYDLDNSQPRSDKIGSNYAALWNTHFEGWLGLHPEVNFWYQKLWVAPDFNAAPPLSLASFARAMGHRDRLNIMPGSWNNKYFGYESSIRSFAKAYRSLPPVVMTDVTKAPNDTVKVRWIVYKGKRYISLQSVIPFESEITIDGKAHKLAPYELVALSDDGDAEPVVTGKASIDYVGWVAERSLNLAAMVKQVADLDAKAGSEAFTKASDAAAMLMMGNEPYKADMAMGMGLMGELKLRREILDPPTLTAGKVDKAPAMTGDLDAWPAAASDIVAETGEYLAGHLYFPNSWTGRDDLSARMRLAHDGEKLYVGVEVRDDKIVERDGCGFRLSTNGDYLNWQAASLTGDVNWAVTLATDETPETTGTGSAGFAYTCRRTDTGYVVEGSAPLKDLKLGKDGIGFLLSVSDDDDQPNRNKAGWAVKQVLMVPHKPNFVYWQDVRNCGKLILGK